MHFFTHNVVDREESYRLPDYGPLPMTDYRKFLKNSKTGFLKKWNNLLNRSEKQLIKLEDNDFFLQDFQLIKLIGSGSFGRVYLVNNRKTYKYHAMKAVLKKTVVELKQVGNARNEKLVLQCINCPFTLRLQYFFKDNSYLYFVFPFIQGGDLYRHLKHSGSFEEDLVRFYLAQVILAIEYLHYLRFVYRDIKPENLLLDHTGYIKLADFGFCKHLSSSHERTYTLCGTPDYFAPEILRNQGYGTAVDWWAIGVLAFELVTGKPPFREKDEKDLFRKILRGSYDLPNSLSDDLKDLIINALQSDPLKRFGNMKCGVDDFKKHKWFRPLNWKAVVSRKATPPFMPFIGDESDTSNFKVFEFKALNVADYLEYGEQFAEF